MSATEGRGRYRDGPALRRPLWRLFIGGLTRGRVCDYFSEEGTDYRYCNHGYWVTGITCSGDYCNDISLQCSRISNFSATNCARTAERLEVSGRALLRRVPELGLGRPSPPPAPASRPRSEFVNAHTIARLAG